MKRSETRRSIWSSLRGGNSNNSSTTAPSTTTAQNTPATSRQNTDEAINVLSMPFSRHSKVNKMSSTERLRTNSNSNNNHADKNNTKINNDKNNNNINNNDKPNHSHTHTRSITPISTDSSNSTLNEVANSRSNLHNTSSASRANKRKSMLNFSPLVSAPNASTLSKQNDLIESPDSSDMEADTTVDSSNILDMNLDLDQDDEDNSGLLDSAFTDYQLALKAFELEDIASSKANSATATLDSNGVVDSVRQSTLYQLKKSPKDYELPTINKDHVPSNELDVLIKDTDKDDGEYRLTGAIVEANLHMDNNNTPTKRMSEVEIKECAGFILVGTYLSKNSNSSSTDNMSSPTKTGTTKKYSKRLLNDDLEDLFDYESTPIVSPSLFNTGNNDSHTSIAHPPFFASNDDLDKDEAKRQIQRTSLYFN